MCETVGAYRILQECGRGSYGVVYLAESAISGQRVALKILNGQQQARELEGLIRYRECRHANLIQIHHLDRLPDGRFYYTMDAADDRGTDGTYRPDTLAARGKVPAAELLPMLDALLDGVAAMHRRGVIHRDIKPENIFFVNKVPVLGDIGLAAPAGDASMVGTPSFLPPEVLAGARTPDKASDLYALGRVAYVALTGLPPHKYPQIPKDLPCDAAPILAFCRAANAKDATIESCRTALNTPPRRSFLRPWVVAAVLFGVLVAIAGVFAVRSHSMRPTQVPSPAVPQPEAVLKNPETEFAQEMRKKLSEVRRSHLAERALPETSASVPPQNRAAEVDELARRSRERQWREAEMRKALDAELGQRQKQHSAILKTLLGKYPPIPEDLLKKANDRVAAVEKEYHDAPGEVGRGEFAIKDAGIRRDVTLATDKLCQLAELTERIERLTEEIPDRIKHMEYNSSDAELENLERKLDSMLKKRQQLAEQLQKEASATRP